MSKGLIAVGVLIVLVALVYVMIPTYRPYERTGPRAVMMKQLASLANAQKTYFQSQGPSNVQARFAGPAPRVPGDPKVFLCDGVQPRPFIPDPTTWTHPMWRVLKYDAKQAMSFAYEMSAGGQGADAYFTIRAIGDQDCDGVYATFERLGTIDKEGAIRTHLVYSNREDE